MNRFMYRLWAVGNPYPPNVGKSIRSRLVRFGRYTRICPYMDTADIKTGRIALADLLRSSKTRRESSVVCGALLAGWIG